MSVKPELLRQMRAARERKDTMVNRKAAHAIKKSYRLTVVQTDYDMHEAVRHQRNERLTATIVLLLLASLKMALMRSSRGMTNTLRELMQAAQRESIRGFARDLVRSEKAVSGKELMLSVTRDDAIESLMTKRKRMLEQLHAESISRFTSRELVQIENELAVARARGESVGTAMDRMAKIQAENVWQAERIGVTETSLAYNLAHVDAASYSDREVSALYSRWTELVDEDSGEPLDEKVCVDSLAIHGQVARRGEVFTMPAFSLVADSKGRTMVPEELVGVSWVCPPNRPNDRAVLLNWRPHWGVSGWRYESGERAQVGDLDVREAA